LESLELEGSAVAIQALKAGRSVSISNSQGPERLSGLVKQLGAGICAALESSSRLRDTHRDTQ